MVLRIVCRRSWNFAAADYQMRPGNAAAVSKPVAYSQIGIVGLALLFL